MELDPSAVWDFAGTIVGKADRSRTTSTATVTRVDADGTAWVHIEGGAAETPVTSSVAGLAPGDVVSVAQEGIGMRVTGNTTDPAVGTRAAKAIRTVATSASKAAQAAQEVADAIGQHFWHDDNGVHVSTEDGNATGSRNVLLNALGMLFRAGSNNLLALVTGSDPGMDVYDGAGNAAGNILASFHGSGVRVGSSASANVDIGQDRIRLYGESGGLMMDVGASAISRMEWVVIDASVSASPTNVTVLSSSTTKTITLSDIPATAERLWMQMKVFQGATVKRASGEFVDFNSLVGVSSTYGTVSFALSAISSGSATLTVTHVSGSSAYNFQVTPMNYLKQEPVYLPAYVFGSYASSYGIAPYAAAFGEGIAAESEGQMVLGRYNVSDPNDVYAAIIGNGTADDDRSNAFTVDWSGNVSAAGVVKATKDTDAVSLNAATATTNYVWSSGTTVTVSLGAAKLAASLGNGNARTLGTIASDYRPAENVWATVHSTDSAYSGRCFAVITSAGNVNLYNETGGTLPTTAELYFTATYAI